MVPAAASTTPAGLDPAGTVGVLVDVRTPLLPPPCATVVATRAPGPATGKAGGEAPGASRRAGIPS